VPKIVETLLQVKERQRRELRERTEAWCAEMLGVRRQQCTPQHKCKGHVFNCLCSACFIARQSQQRIARTQTTTRNLLGAGEHTVTHFITDDDNDDPTIEEHGHVPQRLKEWIPCINVTCGLLVLIAANCLILQCFSLYKAKSV
jgi:hypothetical protein